MGLDMYLEAKYYVCRGKDNVKTSFPIPGGKRITGVTIEGVYWRKANAIHKWFVDNVQEGIDDCGTYHVCPEKLIELMVTIEKILNDRSLAKELLPSQSGFFFGGTEYDDCYWEDLKYTKIELKNILKECSNNWEFYYHSSW